MSENNQQITTIGFKLPVDLKLKERGRKILALHFEHPEWTLAQIGSIVGVSQQRVSQVLRHPKVLAALAPLARQYKQSLTPKAMKAYDSLLDSRNEIVKERAAAKILTENKVFDVPETRQSVEITLKTVQELQAIVDKASNLPKIVIDAEVVEPTDNQPA